MVTLFYIVVIYGILLVILYSMFERSQAPAGVSQAAKQLQTVTEKPGFSVEDRKEVEIMIRDLIQSSGEKDTTAVADLKKKTAPESKGEYL